MRIFPLSSRLVALTVLVFAFGVYGTLAQARNTRVSCGPGAACACRANVTISDVGVCKIDSMMVARLLIVVTVECPTNPPSKCEQEKTVCAGDGSGVSVNCGGSTFTAQPTGSGTWGGVFGAGNCGQIGFTCG